ncbi:MAG: Gfo/Idh/MocA family protein [Terrimicrobiaceae bacterium]
MTPIRFAIIGSGGIAAKHAQAIDAIPGAKLVAVWGQMPEQGQAFAREHGAEFVPDIEELAAREDIDAVTIATPSGTHEMAALPFLRKGKAVLCEKPLEVTLEKVDSILTAARENNAVLAGVLQLRLGFGAQAMKKAVVEGRFGRLALCSAYLKWWRDQSYYDAVDWRGTWNLDGGGALMNQGIHGVDLLQWLAGMPSEVFAFSGCIAHERIEVEDTIAVALKYPNGALGVIEAATSCKPGFAMRIELCGEKGSAVLEDDRIVRWQFDEEVPGDEDIRNAKSGGIVGGSSDPRAIGFEGHRVLIEDLVNALREKRPPMIPGTEARNAVRLILAAYESGQKRLSVRL